MMPRFRQVFRLSTLAALTALVIAVLALPVAASIIDQSYLSSNFYYQGQQALAQTYTAGLNGTLAGIGLHFYNTVTYKEIPIEILTVSNGIPTSNILGSTVLNATYGEITFNQLITFPQIIPQTAGEQYAIALYFGYTSENMTGDPGNVYPGGSLYESSYDGQTYSLWWLLGSSAQYDMSFQTYVNTVPEPASLILLGIGLFGLIGYGRRHHKKERIG